MRAPLDVPDGEFVPVCCACLSRRRPLPEDATAQLARYQFAPRLFLFR